MANGMQKATSADQQLRSTADSVEVNKISKMTWIMPMSSPSDMVLYIRCV